MRITNSTRISLPGSVRVTPAGLYDSVLDHEFHLTASASEMVRLLSSGSTLGNAARQLADRYEVSPQVVAEDARALLELLNERALIVTQGPLLSYDEFRDCLRHPLRAAGLGLAVLLTFEWGTPSARRHQPNLRGLLRGALPFLAVLLTSSLIMTALLWWVVQGSGVQMKRTLLFAILSPMAATLLAIVSVIAHEYGHLLALRRIPATVISRGLSLSVAHPALPTPIGRWVALAGPLLALVAAIATAAILFVTGTDRFFIAMGLLVGASHLYSLAPWHHDGRMLWAPRTRQQGGIA